MTSAFESQNSEVLLKSHCEQRSPATTGKTAKIPNRLLKKGRERQLHFNAHMRMFSSSFTDIDCQVNSNKAQWKFTQDCKISPRAAVSIWTYVALPQTWEINTSVSGSSSCHQAQQHKYPCSTKWKIWVTHPDCSSGSARGEHSQEEMTTKITHRFSMHKNQTINSSSNHRMKNHCFTWEQNYFTI